LLAGLAAYLIREMRILETGLWTDHAAAIWDTNPEAIHMS
jgi:hypothetical protein